MNRTEIIHETATKLRHNLEALESLRIILSEKYQKGEQNTGTYRLFKRQYEKAERNADNLRHKLGELNARLTNDFKLEIY